MIAETKEATMSDLIEAPKVTRQQRYEPARRQRARLSRRRERQGSGAVRSDCRDRRRARAHAALVRRSRRCVPGWVPRHESVVGGSVGGRCRNCSTSTRRARVAREGARRPRCLSLRTAAPERRNSRAERCGCAHRGQRLGRPSPVRSASSATRQATSCASSMR
jgi:hypothetical protein